MSEKSTNEEILEILKEEQARKRRGEKVKGFFALIILCAIFLGGLAFYVGVNKIYEDYESKAQIIAAVTIRLVPNKLGVGEADLRTKPNPQGEGDIVYVQDPSRWTRIPVWLVLDGLAFALNGPSKMVPPACPWPRREDLEEDTEAFLSRMEIWNQRTGDMDAAKAYEIIRR